jgi:hypothetical protein
VYPFHTASFKLGESDLPLWLTAVGYGGHWPVALLRPPADSTADPQLSDDDFSAAWQAVGWMVCLLGILHLIGLINNFSPRLRVKLFPASGPAAGRRLFVINLASVTVATALGMLIAPLLKFGGTSAFVKSLLLEFGGTSAFVKSLFLEFAATSASLQPLLIKFSVTGAFLNSLLPLSIGLIVLLFLSCVVLQVRLWLQEFRLWVRERADDFKRPPIFRKRPPILRNVALTSCNAALWILVAFGLWYWWKLHSEDPSQYGFFFAHRSVHLITGVSPFIPMVPLLAGVYCWAFFEILRLKFDDEERPRLGSSKPFWSMQLPGLSTELTIAKSVNRFLLRSQYVVALWVVFLLWLLALHPLHPFQIFERRSYGFLYAFAFALGVFLMLSSGFRLAQIWSDLKELLAQLDQSRIKAAFDRVREESWIPIWHSGATEREWTNIDRCIERMEQIAASQPKLSEVPSDFSKELRARADEELGRNGQLRTNTPPSKEIQKNLQLLLAWAMMRLVSYWKSDEGARDVPDDDANDKIVLKESDADQKIVLYVERNDVDPYSSQMKRLEQFVALRYVAFIGGVLYQIRLLIIIVAMLFTLILLSLNFYSFEPHRSLIWSFTAMFAIIGFLIVNVLREVHRDNVLSRVTGTRASELGLDFYLRIALFGVGPLATLLATHFPAIGRFFGSFLQPGLEALK